jgi:hypothetical protein
MDDFYIYYVIDEETPTMGYIRAVAPHVIDEMEDMAFIRVPAVYGLQFTVGRKSISHWVVQYDNDSECMILTKPKAQLGIVLAPVFSQVPRIQKNPEMVVTFKKKEKCFHVHIPSKGLKQPKRKLRFFVTPFNDPNMLYFQFPVDFDIASESAGCTIPCPVELPKQFSIFTNKILDRYQLRITR